MGLVRCRFAYGHTARRYVGGPYCCARCGDLRHLLPRFRLPTVAPMLLTLCLQLAVAAVFLTEGKHGVLAALFRSGKNENPATNRASPGRFLGTVHQLERNVNMKLSKISLAVIAATAFGAALAQSSSQVDLINASQNQSGSLNTQSAFVGNASGNGQSKVTAIDFAQNQSGALNRQTANIGNASGNGQSNVTAIEVGQSQSGALNSQEMDLGNASGNGRSNVTAINVKQNQSGALNSQTLSAGNAN
jgi:hypothetical protein